MYEDKIHVFVFFYFYFFGFFLCVNYFFMSEDKDRSLDNKKKILLYLSTVHEDKDEYFFLMYE